MTEQELLSQLKDIVEPMPIGWWPLAIGWWLLAVLILVLLISLGYWLVRRHRQNRFRKLALRELAKIQQHYQAQPAPQAHVAALNGLLKQVAITRYGRAQVSSLHGEHWCRFLSDQAPGVDFMNGPGALLGNAHYQPSQDLPLENLTRLARDWIRRCR